MIRFLSAVVISIWTLLPYVTAHGYVEYVVVDGKRYQGNNPFINPQNIVKSPIRFVNTTFPVIGTNNKSLSCGPNSRKAALIAEAMPGSKLEFKWSEKPGRPWPHEVGPIEAYLAECDGPCSEYDTTNAEWFKFDQLGHKRNSAKWYMNDAHEGKLLDISLPANLKPGNYLVRHELIAIHFADHFRGAQFYPACVQLRVGGNEDGVPKKSDLVRFPGAYNDKDPGLYDKNKIRFYEPNSKYKYPFPGPEIAILVSSRSAKSGNRVDVDVTPPENSSSTKSTSTSKSPTLSAPTEAVIDLNQSCSPRRRIMRRARARP